MKDVYFIGIMAILLLVMGLVTIPTIVDHTNDTNRSTNVLQEENEVFAIHGFLESEITTINKDSDVEIVITDTDTQEHTNITTITEGETKEFEFEGGNVSATLEEAATNQEADMTYEYDQLYGWDSFEKYLLGLFGFLLSMCLLIVIIVVVTAVLSGET